MILKDFLRARGIDDSTSGDSDQFPPVETVITTLK